MFGFTSLKAREHFGCSTLDGVELENQGSEAGTAKSHWEKRIFNGEYMIGTSSKYPVFSAMTLAWFEDTGWYKANYSTAEPLQWGMKKV